MQHNTGALSVSGPSSIIQSIHNTIIIIAGQEGKVTLKVSDAHAQLQMKAMLSHSHTRGGPFYLPLLTPRRGSKVQLMVLRLEKRASPGAAC